jgi:hypothetical protein
MPGRWMQLLVGAVAIVAVLGCDPRGGMYVSEESSACRKFKQRLKDSSGSKFSHGFEIRSKQDDSNLIYQLGAKQYVNFRVEVAIEYDRLGDGPNGDRFAVVGVESPESETSYFAVIQPTIGGYQASFATLDGIVPDSTQLLETDSLDGSIWVRTEALNWAATQGIVIDVATSMSGGWQRLGQIDGLPDDRPHNVAFGVGNGTKGDRVMFSGFSLEKGTPMGMLAPIEQLGHWIGGAFGVLENAKTNTDECPSSYIPINLSYYQQAESDLQQGQDELQLRWQVVFKKKSPEAKLDKDFTKALKQIVNLFKFTNKAKTPSQKQIWKRIDKTQKRVEKLLKGMEKLGPPVTKR